MCMTIMPTGAQFTYTYGDPEHPHRVTEAVSAAGKKYQFEYDEKGNVTSCKIVDPDNNANHIKYAYEYTENFNYPERNIDYFGNSVIFNYDHETGNLESVIDVNGNKTTYNYDGMGRLLFIDEYYMQKRAGGVFKDAPVYNIIWSPGRRYTGIQR